MPSRLQLEPTDEAGLARRVAGDDDGVGVQGLRRRGGRGEVGDDRDAPVAAGDVLGRRVVQGDTDDEVSGSGLLVDLLDDVVDVAALADDEGPREVVAEAALPEEPAPTDPTTER